MLNNLEKIKVIEYRLSNIQDIYRANLINISNPDSITSESDYQLDYCYQLKLDLELKIEALEKEKASIDYEAINDII